MGAPMAANLRTKLPEEDTLYIFDVNKAATTEFQQKFGSGVKVASSVGEVVEHSETIITMLPEPAHVAGVFKTLTTSPPPPLKNGAQRLFIDSSTIDVSTSLAVSRSISECKSLNGTFVDAPVSGGVVGAAAGTLTFMLGGHESILPRAKEILSLMGARILPCGAPGTGLAAKLANNYLLAISNIGVAEAMRLGQKLGLDKDVLKNVINVSSGKCWSSEINNPIDNELKGFEGGFGVALMKKDLGLAVQAAEACGAKLEMAEKAQEVYATVLQKEGSKDFSIVYKWLKDRET
ncbi:NAD binding domain of 6-phosphogluconate dehydrogenase-domain-containing protein [Pyronema omphalodes]|nr:NAD binding domain of 6-phosphogluconate dehydrogenase-domain-containing protein [Pyronema omphalodes]